MSDTRISQLPGATTLTGTEIVPITQNGTTVQTTTQDVANLAQSSGVASSWTGSNTSQFAGTSSYALNAEGKLDSSWTGSSTSQFSGTASFATFATTADSANTVALTGLGITVNGTQLTASVRTVNGVFPSNGNIQSTLTATKLGTSASLVSSGSGTVTGSLQDGLVWIVANDTTSSNNGKVFIYSSASVGRWYPIAPLDTAASDARYLMLTPQSALAGPLNLGSQNLTNGGTVAVTSLTSTGNITATGSIIVTESIRVVGSLSASAILINNAVSASNDQTLGRQIVPAGNLTAYMGEFSGSFADTYIPAGYSSYYINANQSNGTTTLRLWNPSQNPQTGPVTISAQLGSFTATIKTFTGTTITTLASDEWITLVYDQGNVDTWKVISRGLRGINTSTLLTTASISSNVITFTKANATQFSLTVATGSSFPYTGSAAITGSLTVTGSATISDVLVLPFQSPLPSGKPTGSVAISGSGGTFAGMFVYDGTSWTNVKA